MKISDKEDKSPLFRLGAFSPYFFKDERRLSETNRESAESYLLKLKAKSMTNLLLGEPAVTAKLRNPKYKIRLLGVDEFSDLVNNTKQQESRK